jgi:hypothetical protein
MYLQQHHHHQNFQGKKTNNGKLHTIPLLSPFPTQNYYSTKSVISKLQGGQSNQLGEPEQQMQKIPDQ